MQMRLKLSELLSKTEGNEKLEALLADVLSNTEKAVEEAKALGIEPGGEGAK